MVTSKGFYVPNGSGGRYYSPNIKGARAYAIRMIKKSAKPGWPIYTSKTGYSEHSMVWEAPAFTYRWAYSNPRGVSHVLTDNGEIKHVKKARVPRVRKKNNTYTVVSIRGRDEYHDGVFPNYKMARKVALDVDRYLTRAERKKGHRTEIWVNYDVNTGDVERVHEITPKRY